MTYLGEFEQLVLFTVLRLQGDAYGLAIRDAIAERTGKTPSSGAIYTALGRLETKGFVRHRVDASPVRRVGRPRKYYELLPDGARALARSHETLQVAAEGLLGRLHEMARE